MTFRALDHTGAVLSERSFYSIGGGFVVDGYADAGDKVMADDTVLPYPFTTADELLDICQREGMSISGMMLANELVWRSEAELRDELLALWAVMRQCVENGCAAEKILPGGLNVKRRAPSLFRTLAASAVSADAAARNPSPVQVPADPLLDMEWVNLFALAVNEENAAGGRIVTTPTNGAAGIVPAALHYFVKFVPGANDEGVIRFLLTAADERSKGGLTGRKAMARSHEFLHIALEAGPAYRVARLSELLVSSGSVAVSCRSPSIPA